MTSSQYHKPETALTKARELIKCDKKANALEILYDVMRSRRAKQWQSVLEELMMLFVELCVEFRNNVYFRKAIYQYKGISVMENTSSLDQVVRHYLNLVKGKTEEAQQQSKDATIDIEDLDVMETPESLMLSALSLESIQDWSARTNLMQWLKFLWNSYRLILDLLQRNAKLEKMYHEMANDAYEFCIRYGRRNEFKKLSELIRKHTQNVQNQSQPTAINLNNPETQAMHFETRLRQLDCAMELGMYNEAFRTVEDIWGFLVFSRKVASAPLMTNYYSKSAELFLRSGSYLYHAAALHKLFALYRDHKKNITREELSALGSRVLCATIAIPLPNSKANADKFLLSGEYTVTKQKTLATLLNLIQVPTRQSLVRELVRQKIQTIVPPELAQLYQVLEADFQPLKLWELTQPAIEYMSASSDLSPYTTLLHDVLVSKTLLQLSQVYQTLKFDQFFKLCPFMEPIRLERFVIELIHNLELPIRVNHQLQAIIFNKFTDLGISQCDYGGQFVSQSTHVNDPDRLSRQLTMFAQVMQQITDILEVDQSLSSYRPALIAEYKKNKDKHLNVAERVALIERRKEDIESLLEKQNSYFDAQAARIQAEQELATQNEESNLIKEAAERDRLKIEEEKNRLKRRIALENYALFLDSKKGAKINPDELTEEQLDQFDAVKLLEKKDQEIRKKQKEIAEKSRAMAKKLDYFTRAARLLEIPLLQAAIEPEAIEAREFHERTVKETEELSRAEHERQLKERNRLIRMKADVQTLISQLKEARDNRFKVKLFEWEALCDQKRAERFAQIKAKREAEAAAEAQRRAEEEEKKREAERIKEAEREAERLKKEQEAKEAAEREAARLKEETRAKEAAERESLLAKRELKDEIGRRSEAAPTTDSTWERQSASVFNSGMRRDREEASKGWHREGPMRSEQIRRAPELFGRNEEYSLFSRQPRRSAVPEVQSTPNDDDHSEPWKSIHRDKDSSRMRGLRRGANTGLPGRSDVDAGSRPSPFGEARGGQRMRRGY